MHIKFYHRHECKKAYTQWANQYDTDFNKTRDLEGLALQKIIGHLCFEQCLELGCGTGKNTCWLQTITKEITAVDLTPAMLEKAKQKINSQSVRFIEADITQEY